jgi:hypothetical protein
MREEGVLAILDHLFLLMKLGCVFGIVPQKSFTMFPAKVFFICLNTVDNPMFPAKVFFICLNTRDNP